LSLRADPYAQHEIQVYAKTMLEIVEKWVPTACTAFMEYRLKGRSISGKGLEVIKKMIAGDPVTAESIGMSGREWRELMDVLGKSEK
jgi:thymidylate synthase (FAD)